MGKNRVSCFFDSRGSCDINSAVNKTKFLRPTPRWK